MNSWALRLASRVSGLFRQKKAESEFDYEMQTHLQLLTEKFIRQGMGPEDADSAARRQFGNTTLLRQHHRESRTFLSFSTVFQDVRYGLRVLRKSPGFTAIAATSLALAIGANTTIFSVAKRLLLDRLDVPRADELRLLHWVGDKHVAINNVWGITDNGPSGIGAASFSYPVYEQLRRDNRVLEDLFAFKDAGTMNATVGGTAQIVQGELVSGNYFEQLRVRPQLGRPIVASDDAVGAAPVALLSAPFWQRAYGGNAGVLGQTIKVNMVPVTIIGVAPRGFTGARNVLAAPDLFFPMSAQPLVEPRGKGGSLIGQSSPEMWWLNIMGRAKPGVPDAQAQAALDVSLSAAVEATIKPGSGDTVPRLILSDGSRGLFASRQMFGKPIVVLMAVVGLVLLLACANIASLLLARSAARQREISVRLALGAGRARVLRQVLTESLLLSGLGGAAGLLLSFLGRNALPALVSNPWEQNQFNSDFDWKIFGFTAAVTLATGLLFGIAPAWAATRTEVSSGLKETAQTTTRRRKGLGGKAIVAFQLMLSTVLVTGALLFVRTL